MAAFVMTRLGLDIAELLAWQTSTRKGNQNEKKVSRKRVEKAILVSTFKNRD